jgi:hypothetical protein
MQPRIDLKGNRDLKFPMPANWEYLLQYHYLMLTILALKAVTVTLENMAFGGIYDQWEQFVIPQMKMVCSPFLKNAL